MQLNVHKHYRRFPMTVHTILPAIGHPDHVPYIITFAFAGHGRRKKSLLLRINMYRSAVLPVNSSCDTITYFPLAQHAETIKHSWTFIYTFCQLQFFLKDYKLLFTFLKTCFHFQNGFQNELSFPKCAFIFKMWKVLWVLFFLFPKNTYFLIQYKTKYVLNSVINGIT